MSESARLEVQAVGILRLPAATAEVGQLGGAFLFFSGWRRNAVEVVCGKAAKAVEPRAFEFSQLDSGAYKLSKEGFLLRQFAPAAGTPVYDWSKKQIFSLSVVEIGTLIDLGARDVCEFFHDPFKRRSDEGKIRKILKIEPLPDGSGHFFNLSVPNKLLNLDESIYIPVTKAEFTVLVFAFNFILPYLIGWHTFASTIRLEDTARPNNNVSPRYGGDYEWNR